MQMNRRFVSPISQISETIITTKVLRWRISQVSTSVHDLNGSPAFGLGYRGDDIDIISVHISQIPIRVIFQNVDQVIRTIAI